MDHENGRTVNKLSNITDRNQFENEAQCGGYSPAVYKPTLDDLVKKAEEEEVYLKREIDRRQQMLSRNKATLAKLRTVQKLVTPEMEASIVALRDIGVI